MFNIKKEDIHLKTPYSTELQHHLSGRQLLATEIPFPEEILQPHVKQGYVAQTPGIQNKTCLRCGNQNKHLFYTFPCANCGQACTYCRSCIMMGRVSECTPLYTWTGTTARFNNSQTIQWLGRAHFQMVSKPHPTE